MLNEKPGNHMREVEPRKVAKMDKGMSLCRNRGNIFLFFGFVR